MNSKFLLFFFGALFLLSIAGRLLIDIPNVAPVGAFALFAGVYASRLSKWFLLAPIPLMLLSDIFFGTYEWQVMGSVYASFVGIAGIGFLISKRKAPGTIILATLTGSTLFYLTTNFATWAFSPLYPATLEGLVASYTMAIPFFRNTLVGDALYVGLFFGAYEYAAYLLRQRAYRVSPAKA
ncbi:MAG: hypothetical protein Q8P39_03145 [Candidatus Yanofskybacteria bacterium]|nr:hypothetical protein [Candidatus Yanofskybacteria bacterium]